MGRVHGDADRGDAEVVSDVGQDPQAFLLGRDLRRHGAAHERRVQGALGEVAEMVAVVARSHGDRFDVMVRIEPVPSEHDAREEAGRGLPRVDADPAALQLLDRAVVVAGKQPEHRPVGVDAQNRPRDAGGQARHHRPAQADRGGPSDSFGVPGASVADGYVDALLLVVVLLVGDVGDQFLVDSQPGVGEVDGVHREDSFPGCVSS